VKRHWDLAIIGAGPAGMTAALEGARLGFRVAVLDEQPRPGGQVYRHAARPMPGLAAALGPDHAAGMALVERFGAADIEYLPGTTVWDLDGEREIGFSRAGTTSQATAGQVILATGAMERPVPIPGWTLPGVMTVGAAQILLKTAALVPEQPVVLAGGGPLLYLLAWQYLKAGATVRALVETTPRRNHLAAAPYAPALALEAGLIARGRGWLRDLRQAGVERIRGATGLAIPGQGACEAITFTAGGSRRRIETGLVLLHEGVIPNTHVTMALGCDHWWDGAQVCWRPRLDANGRTSLAGILVAGDGGGIMGAQAAGHQGLLAARAAAEDLGRAVAEDLGRAVSAADGGERAARRALRRLAGARRFIDRLYRPAPAQLVPVDDSTIACRCEEVTAGAVRAAARLGAMGLTQAKAYTRCGMGPCQGRLCAPTVAALIAETRGMAPEDVAPYRPRAPFNPITLGTLAAGAKEYR
jgi:NADPH-dependent 2,4-dienoyl-CoA reductase/sulfur reductase-like enzyme